MPTNTTANTGTILDDMDDRPRMHVLGPAPVKRGYKLPMPDPVYDVANILDRGGRIHWAYDSDFGSYYPVVGRYEPAVNLSYRYWTGMAVESNGRALIPKAYTKEGVEGIKNVDTVELAVGQMRYIVACDQMLSLEWPVCYVLSADQLAHLRENPNDRKIVSRSGGSLQRTRTDYIWSYWKGTVDPVQYPSVDEGSDRHLVLIKTPDGETIREPFTEMEYQTFLGISRQPGTGVSRATADD